MKNYLKIFFPDISRQRHLIVYYTYNNYLLKKFFLEK